MTGSQVGGPRWRPGDAGLVGATLDKYEILQKLGEGATATVYRGRHLTIGRDVAIKVLHPHLTASTRYRERFNREARAVGRLSHPNIVSILDYSGSNQEECYIITELVDGLTLQQMLHEHGRLASELAALIAVELTAALQFAHNANIIHRDIKPENVMIRRDGKVKLMDFGVARVLDEGSITLDGALLGSPAYMSPEQAQDQPLDGRSDLFSLGSLLFHTVTGHTPFPGGNASIILRNIIEGNRPDVLELAPDVAPALATVIDTLLRIDREERYPHADAAREAAIRVLEEARIPLDHPSINLRSFLLEPDACQQALRAHLLPVLLERGKERLANKDPLGALQLFNRLLAMDEENAEVISLIQSLHQPAVTPKKHRPLVAFGLAVAVLVAGLGTWALTPPAPGHEEPRAATPSPTSPTAPVEEPTSPAEAPLSPAPLPEPTLPEHALPSAPASTPREAPKTSPLHAPAPLSTPPSAPAASPAQLVVTVARGSWAEIWLDDKKLGYTRKGPSADWVASATAPLALPPGEHTLKVVNDHSEPFVERFTVASGEQKRFQVELRRKPVKVTINPLLDRSCEVTFGSSHYGKISDFNATLLLHDPDPASVLSFACPAPLGSFSAPIGPTNGGEALFLPVSLPQAAP